MMTSNMTMTSEVVFRLMSDKTISSCAEMKTKVVFRDKNFGFVHIMAYDKAENCYHVFVRFGAYEKDFCVESYMIDVENRLHIYTIPETVKNELTLLSVAYTHEFFMYGPNN